MTDQISTGSGVETKRIRLEELVFPEDYFCGIDEAESISASTNAAEEESHEPVIKFAIEDRRLEKLKKDRHLAGG